MNEGFTYREVLLILAKKCFESDLVTEKQIRSLVNSERNFYRVMRALKGEIISIGSDGKPHYIGEVYSKGEIDVSNLQEW